MNPFRADLHCHSHFSDGTDSPEDLIHLAIELGLSGLSITDHDTLEAYETASELANRLHFPLLPGIEFSASHRGEPVHILGYAFSVSNTYIQALCQRHIKRRSERNLRILQKLKRLGIQISQEELENIQIHPQEATHKIKRSLGRPHIALLLIQKGVVSSIKEAFSKYLGEGKAAFDPGERITVEETIDCIHQAQGFAVIAHPQLIVKSSILRDLLKKPFDGLEAYYARISPQEEARYIKMAEERQWIITGGSDYHGSVKPQNSLGTSWVNQETFDKLYKHYSELVD